MPQNPLSQMTLEAHDMLKFNSRLAIVDVTLQPLTAGTGLSDSNMQGLVPAAAISRDARDQRRKENADYLEAVLKWLKDTKGVKQIIKLVVRDDKDGPCSDEVIERCLKIYDIRYLDWHKEDICVQTLLEGQAKNLVELSLYSSGKDSTFWSWSSNDGLRRLEKVRHLPSVNHSTKLIHSQLKRVTLNINSVSSARETEPTLITDCSRMELRPSSEQSVMLRILRDELKKYQNVKSMSITTSIHLIAWRIRPQSCLN